MLLGVTAAYDLIRSGNFNVTVLESNSFIGGRLRKLEGFADFPIDIGGEWVHHKDPRILRNIIDQDSARLDQIQLAKYLPDFKIHDGVSFKGDRYFHNDPHFRFVNYTWFDFFNDLIAPVSTDYIKFNCVVNTVDYSSPDKPVSVSCQDGRTVQGDFVIMAVPVTVLQSPSDIAFVPRLPQSKVDALDEVRMPPGAKLFLKFDETFYHQAFQLQGETADDNERLFYDATLDQDSEYHVLGMVVVGEVAAQRFAGQPNEFVTSVVLQELDLVYEGKASQLFLESHYQDWSAEPYIRGSYSFYDESKNYEGTIRTIANPHDRIFFAGEYLPVDGWYGFVHGAAFSGRSAASRIRKVVSASDMSISDSILFSTSVGTLIVILSVSF